MPAQHHSLAMDMSRAYAHERGFCSLGVQPLNRDYGDTSYRHQELTMRQWEAALTADDRRVLKVARDLYLHFPLEGGCYHLSFFLACYLRERFGIKGHAEVGFVNDGTSALHPSHAWYVLDGRITDIALSRPVNPTENWRGPLTILGRDIIPGWQYSYYTDNSLKGTKIINEMLRFQAQHGYAALPGSRKLHIKMAALAKSYISMRTYLGNAIAGYTYHEMADILDKKQM